MQTLVIGAVCLIIGILGLINWWSSLLVIIKGLIPIALIVGGLMVLSAGIGMKKESTHTENPSEPDDSPLKK